MTTLKTRAARITMGVSALAVGAAIALPATALAADPPVPAIKINQSELTANGTSAKTDIAMILPAGQQLCLGPSVYKGTITAQQAVQPGFSTEMVYPAHQGLITAIATKEIAESDLSLVYNIKGTSLTTSPTLGNGELTAMMICVRDAETVDDITVYLRHIKDGQGVSANNGPGTLGGLDFGGSLGSLLGSLATGS